MRITKRTLLGLLTVFFAFSILLKGYYYAEAKSLQEIQQEIEEYQGEIDRLSSQANTLKNQIAQFNAQIYLASLKIAETEERITLLGGRIYQLEGSLGALSKAFSSRVNETYKMKRLESAFIFLITSQDLSEAVVRYHYLKRIQEADRSLLVRLQTAQNTYQEEKTDQEVLQEDLEEQKQVLAAQKAAKSNLLAVTRQSEARYQGLLDQAQRELQALAQSQFTGKREVKQGEIIGLMGNTGFSTGPHLHFGYYNIKESEADSMFGSTDWYYSRVESPEGALQSRVLAFEEYSCNGITADITRSIGGGPYPWPMADPYITQCYGSTPYSYVYKVGQLHRGLDMSAQGSVGIKAVADGVAYFYRGGTSFGNNVRIFHSNGKMSLYLHLR